jgi:Site-specific DNA methylase
MLKPLFKYPGGKSSEYKHISHLFPQHQTYVEPFLGGGAVFWADDADRYIVNDYSEEVTNIYRYTKDQNSKFLRTFLEIANLWQQKEMYVEEVVRILAGKARSGFTDNAFEELNVMEDAFDQSLYWAKYKPLFDAQIQQAMTRKLSSLRRISEKTVVTNLDENALGILGAAIYMMIREIYNQTAMIDNPILKTVSFYFLREFAYSSMFRFNSEGGFNVPFGGNSYAKKSLLSRYAQLTDNAVVDKLAQTTIFTGDFAEQLVDEAGAFIFLDPPYDSEFSTYNQNSFDRMEQVRLRDALTHIQYSKWLMVIKHTDFIEELYTRDGWYISRFDKNYSVNFKNRNDQAVEHLVITNYEV